MKIHCQAYNCTLEASRCVARQHIARKPQSDELLAAIECSQCRACDQGIAVAAEAGIKFEKLGPIKVRGGFQL